jgi:hypothetical protein
MLVENIETAPLPPRDFVESQILGIFKESLGVEHLSIRDDFFQLGIQKFPRKF